MQPVYPFRLLATSREFCVASSQSEDDCESVQFISGAVLEAARNATPTADGQQGQGQAQQLLLSMGINDCEAKLARIPMARVWEMLRPLPGEKDACQVGGGGLEEG
eukprot:CAMPEP_0196682718 /NCGR_PEP_ID=MMETSP1090-20130531/9424_1 /TAXON_ID=37098 /ORGANISM="Isochrysis sp, Strain CCMP1244" /LENGTH=105 /DNA_ID=CAMNT_0042021145 /DNA_START=28 /DNA_END=345 /DNA_ORIENTATION=-